MKVLIKNYNTTTSKFDLFHEEIVDLSTDELHKLILELPDDSESLFTILVVTEHRIFYKSGESLHWRTNAAKLIKKYRKIPLTDIQDNILNPPYFISIYLRKETVFAYIFGIYMFLGMVSLPIINLYSIIIGFGQITSNLSVLIIFIFLSLVSFLTLLFFAKTFYSSFSKGTRAIDIELEYSSIEHLYHSPNDMSRFIMLDLQLFYPFLFEIYSLLPLVNFLNHYWLILIIFSPNYLIYLIMPGFFVIRTKKAIKARKKILKSLMKLIQSESGPKKNFYLSLYLKLKEEGLVKIGLLTKLSALITFLPLFLA